ncbi:hypothetical protein ACFCZV_02390 [Streptomyces hydrogenans]|uniref:hypothetical protein n=1 Tax=Streptomyces hydrogenans TaxID=1873719 RepID=UPI0035E20E7B
MGEDTRDPLARALFPEDGPPGAGDDPEVARARADVDLLREQLGVLAAALTAGPAPAEPVSVDPAPAEPVPEPAVVRPRRRARIVGWALAACLALGVLGTGGAWLAARPGGDGGIGAAEAKLTPGGIVACASDVAEGTVVRAEPLGDGEFRVVLRVERRYKPAGPDSGELAFRGWAAEASSYRPGTRLLAVVPRSADEGVLTFRQDMEPPGELGEDVGPVRDELEYGRKWLAKALPEAGGACPGRG